MSVSFVLLHQVVWNAAGRDAICGHQAGPQEGWALQEAHEGTATSSFAAVEMMYNVSADLASVMELTTTAPLPAATMQLIAHRTP